MSYKVFVEDNFHYMDEDDRTLLGDFETFEAAVAACERVVNDFLEKTYQAGMSAEELYKSYVDFGQDPFIVGGERRFSAWDYAKKQSARLANESK